MLISTKGIVLRTIKYGETSLIADIFTEEKGLLSYIINGVRKAKSRMQASMFMPMSILDMVAYHSEKSKLHRIKEVRLATPFQSIPFNVRKGAICLFLSEFCSKCIRGTETNPALYSLIEHYLLELDSREEGYFDLHLEFLVQFADDLGFGIQAPETDSGEYFDMLIGRITNDHPHHEYFSSKGDLLTELISENRKRVFTRKERNGLLDDLLLFYKLHIDDLPQIKAHEVLRQVL